MSIPKSKNGFARTRANPLFSKGMSGALGLLWGGPNATALSTRIQNKLTNLSVLIVVMINFCL